MVSKVLFSSKSDEWSTPQDLFDALSKYTDLKQELQAIFNSEECVNFTEIVKNISSLSVATALLGGLLSAWCHYHGEDFLKALEIMLAVEREDMMNIH